jgi:hypothetical protein
VARGPTPRSFRDHERRVGRRSTAVLSARSERSDGAQRPTPQRLDDALDGIEREAGPDAVEDLLFSLPDDDEYEEGPTKGVDEPAESDAADDG